MTKLLTMSPLFIICLCLFPMLAEAKWLNYFVYCIIRMLTSKSIHNNAETPIGDDIDQGQGLVTKHYVMF